MGQANADCSSPAQDGRPVVVPTEQPRGLVESVVDRVEGVTSLDVTVPVAPAPQPIGQAPVGEVNPGDRPTTDPAAGERSVTQSLKVTSSDTVEDMGTDQTSPTAGAQSAAPMPMAATVPADATSVASSEPASARAPVGAAAFTAKPATAAPPSATAEPEVSDPVVPVAPSTAATGSEASYAAGSAPDATVAEAAVAEAPVADDGTQPPASSSFDGSAPSTGMPVAAIAPQPVGVPAASDAAAADPRSAVAFAAPSGRPATVATPSAVDASQHMPRGHSLAVMNLLVPGLSRLPDTVLGQVQRIGSTVDQTLASVPAVGDLTSRISVAGLTSTVLEPVLTTTDALSATLVDLRLVLEPPLDAVTDPVRHRVVETVDPVIPGGSGGGSTPGFTLPPVAPSTGTGGSVVIPWTDQGFMAGGVRAPDVRHDQQRQHDQTALVAQAEPSVLSAPPQASFDSQGAEQHGAAVPAPNLAVTSSGSGGLSGSSHAGSGSDHSPVVFSALRLPGIRDAAVRAAESWRLPGSLTFDPGHSPD